MATELLGIPFEEGGRDFRAVVGGTDCLGIVLEFLRRIGVHVPDPWQQLAEQWRAGADRVSDYVRGDWCGVDGRREVGDIGETADGRHVCVYVGEGYVLHACRETTSFLAPVAKRPVARWWRLCA